MKTETSTTHRRTALALLCSATLAASSLDAADNLLPGYDLFMTLAPTRFLGVDWAGVDLGTFDFGGAIGIQPVNGVDTIVQRLSPVPPAGATIPIELVALQLVSVQPIDLGAGLNLHYITLQSDRGGPASVGQLTVSIGPEGDPHGQVVNSFFDIFFDVRLGSNVGPILQSSQVQLTGGTSPWSHNPPPGGVQIPGANTFLNGLNRDNDFWIPGPYSMADSVNVHTVGVPEASTWTAVGAVLFGVVVAWRRSVRGPNPEDRLR